MHTESHNNSYKFKEKSKYQYIDLKLIHKSLAIYELRLDNSPGHELKQTHYSLKNSNFLFLDQLSIQSLSSGHLSDE